MRVRDLVEADVPACEDVLGSVPEWFGIEEANRAYVESLSRLPGAVADDGGDVVGFVALSEHGLGSVEIDVLAVRRDRHRTGVGSALVAWAEAWCRGRGVRWLHVKTLGPSREDEGYAGTREFYLGRGFEPLFEAELWGPENPALVLVTQLLPESPDG